MLRFPPALALILALVMAGTEAPGRADPGSPQSPSPLEIAHRLKQGADRTADSLAEALVAEVGRERGARSREMWALRDTLASVFESHGRQPAARNHSQAFVELSETLFPGDPRVLPSAYGRHARLCRRVGDLEGCESYALRSLAFDGDPPRLPAGEAADYLEELALALRGRARLEAALGTFERALERRRHASGDSSDALVRTLPQIAAIERRLGRLASARRTLDRALVAATRMASPDTAARLDLYTQDAILLSALRRNESALGRFLQCLALSRGTARSNDFETARYQNNVGVTLVLLGRSAEARAYHDSALTLRTRIRDSSGVLESHQNLGLAALGSGNLDEAESRFRLVLDARRGSGATAQSVADALSNLAVVHLRRGRFAAAESLYAEVLRLRARVMPPIYPAYASALFGWAEARAGVGDTIAALEAALRSDSLTREHLVLAARGLTEHELMGVSAARPGNLAFALSLATRSPRAPLRRAVYDAVIRSRALILDELATRRRRVSASADSSATRLQDSLGATQERLAAWVFRRTEIDAARYLEGARRLQAERERIEAELSVRSDRFRDAMRRRRIGLAEVAAALPAGSALVSYVRFRERRHPGEPRWGLDADGGPGDSMSRYVAFVLRAPADDPVVVPLGSGARIDSLVALWRERVATPPGGVFDRTAQEIATARAGRALAAAVWDPVASALTGVPRVFLVPAGPLCLVNLAALPARGGSRYLVETGPLLHTLSAERDIARPPSATGAAGMLILAGPDFGATSKHDAVPADCGDLARLRFAPLPAAAREAGVIGAAWDSAATRTPGEPGRREAAVRTGAGASESAFRQLGPGRRVIHLATHGFFLDQCPDSTPTALLLNDSPLLQSGLGLAASPPGTDGTPAGEDGVLTAEEISAVDLEGVEWVVLSACETGLGTIHPSEGVLGLRRAFTIAGARTTIMSLWRVEDRAALHWMRLLYEARLRRGLSTAEACREASLAILKRARSEGASVHPSGWAAFVAAGDWR